MKIVMELSALEAIKAKKPIYLAKSLHEIEQRASREMRAAYRPSEREVVMETRPTLGKSVVLTLVQDTEDPTSFEISRGAEMFGSDKVTLTELLSMDAAKQGDEIFFGRSPVPTQCPRCCQQIVTIVDYESGTGTWLIALVIFFLGGFLGCCLIPFCVPSCQDAIHRCPSCGSTIGRRHVF